MHFTPLLIKLCVVFVQVGPNLLTALSKHNISVSCISMQIFQREPALHVSKAQTTKQHGE